MTQNLDSNKESLHPGDLVKGFAPGPSVKYIACTKEKLSLINYVSHYRKVGERETLLLLPLDEIQGIVIETDFKVCRYGIAQVLINKTFYWFFLSDLVKLYPKEK